MNWTVDSVAGSMPVAMDTLGDAAHNEVIVVLAHGAGGSMDHRTVVWLAGLVRKAGAATVRFNFPYRAQGRSMPDRMPSLISSYKSVGASVRERLAPSTLAIGGHSMGGRTASMLEAEESSADGLLLFGYPLHPAGQPTRLRDAHLGSIRTPTLQLSGTDDPLCTKSLMEEALSRCKPPLWDLQWIEGADHSYTVKKSSGRTRSDVEREIVDSVKSWLGSLNRRS